MRKTSGREFLALLGATGAGLLAGKASGAVGVRAINDAESGMLYDATRCVGCKACMVACKRVNRSTRISGTDKIIAGITQPAYAEEHCSG